MKENKKKNKNKNKKNKNKNKNKNKKKNKKKFSAVQKTVEESPLYMYLIYIHVFTLSS